MAMAAVAAAPSPCSTSSSDFRRSYTHPKPMPVGGGPVRPEDLDFIGNTMTEWRQISRRKDRGHKQPILMANGSVMVPSTWHTWIAPEWRSRPSVTPQTVPQWQDYQPPPLETILLPPNWLEHQEQRASPQSAQDQVPFLLAVLRQLQRYIRATGATGEFARCIAALAARAEGTDSVIWKETCPFCSNILRDMVDDGDYDSDCQIRVSNEQQQQQKRHRSRHGPGGTGDVSNGLTSTCNSYHNYHRHHHASPTIKPSGVVSSVDNTARTGSPPQTPPAITAGPHSLQSTSESIQLAVLIAERGGILRDHERAAVANLPLRILTTVEMLRLAVPVWAAELNPSLRAQQQTPTIPNALHMEWERIKLSPLRYDHERTHIQRNDLDRFQQTVPDFALALSERVRHQLGAYHVDEPSANAVAGGNQPCKQHAQLLHRAQTGISTCGRPGSLHHHARELKNRPSHGLRRLLRDYGSGTWKEEDEEEEEEEDLEQQQLQQSLIDSTGRGRTSSVREFSEKNISAPWKVWGRIWAKLRPVSSSSTVSTCVDRQRLHSSDDEVENEESCESSEYGDSEQLWYQKFKDQRRRSSRKQQPWRFTSGGRTAASSTSSSSGDISSLDGEPIAQQNEFCRGPALPSLDFIDGWAWQRLQFADHPSDAEMAARAAAAEQRRRRRRRRIAMIRKEQRRSRGSRRESPPENRRLGLGDDSEVDSDSVAAASAASRTAAESPAAASSSGSSACGTAVATRPSQRRRRRFSVVQPPVDLPGVAAAAAAAASAAPRAGLSPATPPKLRRGPTTNVARGGPAGSAVDRRGVSYGVGTRLVPRYDVGISKELGGSTKHKRCEAQAADDI